MTETRIDTVLFADLPAAPNIVDGDNNRSECSRLLAGGWHHLTSSQKRHKGFANQ
ncbi:hypothetical protein [Pseudanabaena sp. UWO311]|uniref:hypothetical protein n=1 Tax=Pseudanabaena sp. UWO311 TaxID=2487337 RepID=UPI001680AF7B|nr:hypothetical protein [Pseudanabaena sp. UWO311]